MPPQRRAERKVEYVTAFERAHPKLQRFLLTACQASSPLLLATTLFAAGFMKRPLWERIFMWRAALFSFLSRWVLVTCAITWTLRGWGGDEQEQQEQDPGAPEGD
jgi:hypothetical protein